MPNNAWEDYPRPVSRPLSSAASCEVGGVQWLLAPGTPISAAEPVLAGVLREIAGGAANLRRGRRKELYRIAVSGSVWLVKVQHYDRGASWLRRHRRSQARRELSIAAALGERGIEAPLPLAAGDVRSGARLDRCYLVARELPDVSDLRTRWQQAGGLHRQRAAWADAMGRSARRLHDAGLVQEDFAPNNFLLRDGDPVAVLPVDFERAHLVRRVGASRRRRMIARLDQHLADASAADKLRFLRAYHGDDDRAARRGWRAVARIAPRMAARDLARLRRNAAQEGRRVRRVDWGDWHGWALRDAPELPLAEARTAGPKGAEPFSTHSLQVEADGELWRGSGAGSPVEARRLWAQALLLWSWGALAPRPVACLARSDDQLRIWLARDPTAETLLSLRRLAPALDAGVVLVTRLRGLGRLDPWLSPRKIAVVRRPDGRLKAQLLSPTALRVGTPAGPADRRRARQFLEERLQEVDQHIEMMRETLS